MKDQDMPMITDYNKYTLSLKQKLYYIILASVFLIFICYIFFRSFLVPFVLSPSIFLYPRYKKSILITKRKAILNNQFKDAICCISSSISSGRSVEQSFKCAYSELKLLYPNEDDLIICELKLIGRKLDMNESIEVILSDFSKRSHLEDIKNFADVFIICKSTGGNLVEVLKNTISVINQRIEIKNEINVLIAEKKINQKILNIVPFGFVILIAMGSPDYIQPLYEGYGRLVMLFVLFVLISSYFLGNKIIDIKV
jgi:tight adherence protein B